MKLNLTDLCIKYPEKTISITTPVIIQGNCIITGENGIGKSSLLKALMKLQDYNGTMMIDDIDHHQIPFKQIRQMFSYIPQKPLLFEELTTKQHCQLFAIDFDVVMRYIALVNKEQIVNKPIKNLSGGEQQMVNLFLGLSKKSEVLLIDEPLNNISVINKEVILEILRSDPRQKLIITHKKIELDAKVYNFIGQELICTS